MGIISIEFNLKDQRSKQLFITKIMPYFGLIDTTQKYVPLIPFIKDLDHVYQKSK